MSARNKYVIEGEKHAVDEKANERVKTVENTIKILDLILAAGEPLGVNEISRQASISLTTAFRILKTLKCTGWVYQDQEDRYLIGHKISFVTEKNNFYMALKEIAYYTMTRLSEQTSQAMNLVVRDNTTCYIIQQSHTKKIVDYVPPVGSQVSVYASACGKVLLSELPILLRDAILDNTDIKPITQYTILDRDHIVEQLEKCRLDGYALDAGESMEQAYCIAVPVRFGDNGEIIAALSFSGIIGATIDDEKIQTYFSLLKDAASEISEKLYALDGQIVHNQSVVYL